MQQSCPGLIPIIRLRPPSSAPGHDQYDRVSLNPTGSSDNFLDYHRQIRGSLINPRCPATVPGWWRPIHTGRSSRPVGYVVPRRDKCWRIVDRFAFNHQVGRARTRFVNLELHISVGDGGARWDLKAIEPHAHFLVAPIVDKFEIAAGHAHAARLCFFSIIQAIGYPDINYTSSWLGSRC